MDRQLRVGLVGCGGISRHHLPNILATPQLRLAATMDVVEDAARERAEQAEADYFTTDLDRVLSDDGIDAVLICSTHDTHADLAVQSLEAGKQVFCEKPLAMTMEEARRIQEAVHRTGIPLMSGWWFKHSPVTKRLREVIREPRFVLFTCRIPPGPYTSPDPYGKGGLLDTAGYNLHWTWHVMRSQPVEVSAVGMDGQATSTSTINVRFANGGIGTSIFSDLGSGGILPKHYAEVHAGEMSAATLRFGNLVFDGTDEPGIEENRYHNGFDEEMEMFADLCLRGRPEPHGRVGGLHPHPDIREGRRVDEDGPVRRRRRDPGVLPPRRRPAAQPGKFRLRLNGSCDTSRSKMTASICPAGRLPGRDA